MTEIFEVINNIIENDDNVNQPEQKKRGRPRKEQSQPQQVKKKIKKLHHQRK